MVCAPISTRQLLDVSYNITVRLAVSNKSIMALFEVESYRFLIHGFTVFAHFDICTQPQVMEYPLWLSPEKPRDVLFSDRVAELIALCMLPLPDMKSSSALMKRRPCNYDRVCTPPSQCSQATCPPEWNMSTQGMVPCACWSPTTHGPASSMGNVTAVSVNKSASRFWNIWTADSALPYSHPCGMRQRQRLLRQRSPAMAQDDIRVSSSTSPPYIAQRGYAGQGHAVHCRVESAGISV